MTRSRHTLSEKGFTIVELLISMAVFTSLLLICAVATAQIGRMYYKSTIKISTQQATRSTSDLISQQIRLFDRQPIVYEFDLSSQSLAVLNPPVSPSLASYVLNRDGGRYMLCLGSVQYYIQINRQLKQSPSIDESMKQSSGAIIVRQATTFDCQPPIVSLPDKVEDLWTNSLLSDGSEIMPFNTRLAYMHLIQVSEQSWSLAINIISGDQDTIDPGSWATNLDQIQCVANIFDSQFCSASRLETVILKRIK